MNLNDSRVWLELSDMTNSNILSTNLPNEREVLSLGIQISDFSLFFFLPFPFYFSILLHLRYTTIIWKYKVKCSKEGS